MTQQFQYHCDCEQAPNCACLQAPEGHDPNCECDSCCQLTHIEIDPQGITHIWPYSSEMRNRWYHPEWAGESAPQHVPKEERKERVPRTPRVEDRGPRLSQKGKS